MKINKVYCLFEQSGTFKKQFKSFGINAADYDILNDFGETDHQIDLFAEISEGYNGLPSLFDEITKDDLIIAFFPCIRFTSLALLQFRGQQSQLKNKSWKDKFINCIRLQNELTDLYTLVNKLFIICNDRGLRLIVENPYSEEHYLRRYWCYPPAIIDKDRRLNGDYYKKPTQYWFYNCKPEMNLLLEEPNNNSLGGTDTIRMMEKCDYEKTGAKTKRVARSMIHPEYANRFIRQYILEQGDI